MAEGELTQTDLASLHIPSPMRVIVLKFKALNFFGPSLHRLQETWHSRVLPFNPYGGSTHVSQPVFP
jgi:hypothetical protein